MPDAPVIAYCGPGRKEAATLVLTLLGYQVDEVREHPWVTGWEGVFFEVKPWPEEGDPLFTYPASKGFQGSPAGHVGQSQFLLALHAAHEQGVDDMAGLRAWEARRNATEAQESGG